MKRPLILALLLVSGALLEAADSGITPAPFRGATAGGDLVGTYPSPTLATSGVTAAQYGDATHVPQVTFDAKGRATAAASVLITGTAPGGSAGGDLLGTYPNPTVNWAVPGTLGSTTPSTVKATSVTDTGLTSGRVPFAGTGGLLGDSANFLWATTTGATSIGSTSAASLSVSDSGTNNLPLVVSIQHSTSGTPTAGYGNILRFNAHSDTNTQRAQGEVRTEWVTATDASRASRLTLWAFDTAQRECLRADASGSAASIGFLGATAVTRQAATVDPATAMVNYGLISSGGPTIRTKRYLVTGINANSATTDTAIANLPAKYRVDKVTLYDASISMTTATFGVFTSTGGGGTAIVANATQTGLTTATKMINATVATTTDYLTATTIQFRVGTAQGSAATVSVIIEVTDLN